MTTTRIPQSKQPMALEHYQKLVEAKRKAEAESRLGTMVPM
jgi:hypothetical protein